jgi:hypothetical protein
MYKNILPVYNSGENHNFEKHEYSYFFKEAAGFSTSIFISSTIMFLAAAKFESYYFVMISLMINVLFLCLGIFIYRGTNRKKNYNSNSSYQEFLPDEEIVFAPADGIITSIEVIDENHIKYIIKPRPIIDSLVQVLPMDGDVNYINYTCGGNSKLGVIKTNMGEIELGQNIYSNFLKWIYPNGPIDFFRTKTEQKNDVEMDIFSIRKNRISKKKNIVIPAGTPFGLFQFLFVLLKSAECSLMIPIRAAERGRININNININNRRYRLIFKNRVSINDVVRAGESILGVYLIS